MEILFERNRNVYLEYFKIDKGAFLKRRLMIGLGLLVLFGVIALVLSSMKLLMFAPLFGLVGYKLPYFEILNNKSQDDLIREYLFPDFVKCFLALIESQGNVYQTLKATIPRVKQPLRAEVEKLVSSLETSSVNTHDDFMRFADAVGSHDAYNIVSILHEFHEEGVSKEDLRSLEDTANKLQENKVNVFIINKANTIEKHANPLLVYTLFWIISFTMILFVANFRDLPL